MIKGLNLLFAISVVLLLQGCISIHNGVIAPNSVNVSSDNFQIVKTIGGKATAGYFLGLGGGGKNGLVKEAKKNMYAGYNLNANEMITNITVDDKKLFFFGGIYMEHTVFVSADVVRFGEFVDKNNKPSSINLKPKSNDTKSSAQENKSNSFSNPTEINKMTKLLDIETLKNATNIYYQDWTGNYIDCKIVDIVNSSSTYVKYRIIYPTKSGEIKTKNAPHNYLGFKFEDRYLSFSNLKRN